MTKNITKIDGLSRFDNDGIEIFIDPQGNSFASLRGVARMAEKTAETVRRFSVSRNFKLQEVEVDTPGGKQGVSLFDKYQIAEVLKKYNPDRLEQFAIIGIDFALHQIAGYQSAIDPQLKFKAIVHDSLLMFDESDPRHQSAVDKFFDESDPNFVQAIDRMTDTLVCTLYGELAEQLEKYIDGGGDPMGFYSWKQAKNDAEYVAKKFLNEGRQRYSAKINEQSKIA